MPITLTSSGLIQHTDFSGGKPSWGNEIKTGSGAITYANGECTILTSSSNTDIAYLVYSTALPSNKKYIVRAKYKTTGAGAQWNNILTIIDNNTCPTGGYADDGPLRLPNSTVYESNLDAVWRWVSAANYYAVVKASVSNATYYVVEIPSDSTQSGVALYSEAMALLGSAMLNWGDASGHMPNPTYNLWAVLGNERETTSTNSDIVVDYFSVYTSNNITMTGLNTGNAVRIYNASDTVIQSAVESNGTATLGCSLVGFPFTGYIKVWQDNNYNILLSRYPSVGNATDIWGGDNYTYPYYAYSITATADVTASPNTWKFLGSNDNINWTLLDTQTNITFIANEKKSFTITNTLYTHYRLYVSKNNGARDWDIHQLALPPTG